MTIESTITPRFGDPCPMLPHGRYLHEAKLFQYREGLAGTLLARRPFLKAGAKAVFERSEIPFDSTGTPPGGMRVYVEVVLDDGTRFWRSDVFGYIGGAGTLVVDMSGVRQAAPETGGTWSRDAVPPRTLDAVQALRLQPGDVLVGYLGDRASGWIPSLDAAKEYQGLLSAAVSALGLEGKVAVLTLPVLAVELAVARPSSAGQEAFKGLVDQIQAGIAAADGGKMLQTHMTSIQDAVYAYLEASGAPQTLPAQPVVLSRAAFLALERYVAAVQSAITAAGVAAAVPGNLAVREIREALQQAGASLLAAARGAE